MISFCRPEWFILPEPRVPTPRPGRLLFHAIAACIPSTTHTVCLLSYLLYGRAFWYFPEENIMMYLTWLFREGSCTA